MVVLDTNRHWARGWEWMKTYRGVDWLVSLHAAVLMRAMVRLAKGDAWKAPGN
jgi:hypothetical protein